MSKKWGWLTLNETLSSGWIIEFVKEFDQFQDNSSEITTYRHQTYKYQV